MSRSIRLAVVCSLAAAPLFSQDAAARDGTNSAILGGLAGGLLGGVAAGALVGGGQAVPPRPSYAYPVPRAPYYAPPPRRRVYEDDEETMPVALPRRRIAPVCHEERRKVWLDDDEYTYKVVEVCE